MAQNIKPHQTDVHVYNTYTLTDKEGRTVKKYTNRFPLKKPKDPLNLGKEEDKQSEVNSDLEDERSKRPREEDSGTESNADENMD